MVLVTDLIWEGTEWFSSQIINKFKDIFKVGSEISEVKAVS